MKMELIEGSETSAITNQTPGNYPKGNLLYSVHGESLKSRIRYLDKSVFRKQGQLETLILSENVLQSVESGIFGDCKNLRYLSLSANSISEVNRSAFYGLEHLEHLDLSKNNIEEPQPGSKQDTVF